MKNGKAWALILAGLTFGTASALSLNAASASQTSTTIAGVGSSTTFSDTAVTPAWATLRARVSIDAWGAHIRPTTGGGGAYDSALFWICQGSVTTLQDWRFNATTGAAGNIDGGCNFGVPVANAAGYLDDL